MLLADMARDMPQRPPQVAATLEKEAGALLGMDYVLAVSSGTAALEVVLGAAGIGPRSCA